MARAVCLAGVALELDVPDGPIPPGLEQLLAHLPAAELPAAATICCGIAGPPVPSRPPDLVRERLEFWIDDADLHLRDATGATAHLTKHRAVIGGGGARAANGFHALFLYALTHLLAHRDLFVLHGAGVVRDDQAYVILGGSGAGKSTLAVSAAEHAWGLLGDDMVVLADRGRRLEVTGVPRAVLVPPEHGWTTPHRVNDRDARARLWVDAPLQAGWFPVAATIVVEHAEDDEGVIRRVGGHDVFAASVGSFVSAVNPPLLRRFLSTGAALSRLPGWALGHGRDPHTRRAVAVRLLTAAADGAT